MKTRSRRPSAALLVALLALVVALGDATYAAGGPSLLLGHSNKTHKTTKLTSKGKGAALSLKSKKGPAAAFRAGSGQPPFTVDSSTKVPGLDADLLDGLDASAFAPANPSTSAVVSGPARSVPNGALTTLPVDEVSYDPSGMRTVSAPDYLTAPRTGTYVFSASVAWSANATGFRKVEMDTDTASLGYAVAPPNSGAQLAQNVAGIAHLNAGERVHIAVLQTSGGNLGGTLWNFEGAYVGP
jgi:hypothetical protein